MDKMYQTLSLMIAFATLVVLILQFAFKITQKKK
ncbi:putative holin-like toxin [Desulfosporosinus youngiae]|nr:putative holin-like toxin [Desulfosporosinus youngiae]